MNVDSMEALIFQKLSQMFLLSDWYLRFDNNVKYIHLRIVTENYLITAITVQTPPYGCM